MVEIVFNGVMGDGHHPLNEKKGERFATFSSYIGAYLPRAAILPKNYPR